MFIEILFKKLFFKGGVLIYAEHCIYTRTQTHKWVELKSADAKSILLVATLIGGIFFAHNYL